MHLDPLFLLIVPFLLVAYLLIRSRRIKQYYIHVDKNQAIVVYKKKRPPKVSFKGAVVYPKDQYALVSFNTLPIVFSFQNQEGLYCKDNTKINLTISFYLRVGNDTPSILKMLSCFGNKEINRAAACKKIFTPFATQAIEHVIKNFTFENLFVKRNELRAHIHKRMSRSLANCGYFIEDIAIDSLDLTPITQLDPNNERDAQSIEQIQQIVKRQKQLEAQLKRKHQEDIMRKIEEAQQAINQL